MLVSGTVSGVGVVATCILAAQRYYETGCTGGAPCAHRSSGDAWLRGSDGSGDSGSMFGGIVGSGVVPADALVAPDTFTVFGATTVSGEAYVGVVFLTGLLALLGTLLVGDLALYHMVLKCKGVSTYTYWMNGQDPIPSHLYCCCFWQLAVGG